MTAAVFSARNGEKVTVFERSDRILKKLLATGNGRCNLSSGGHGNPSDSEKPGIRSGSYAVYDYRIFYQYWGKLFVNV